MQDGTPTPTSLSKRDYCRVRQITTGYSKESGNDQVTVPHPIVHVSGLPDPDSRLNRG
jgi:hypothetical protein